MKKVLGIITLAVVSAFMFVSCGLDNYDYPDATLKVTVTYNGQKIGLRDGYVRLQAYEPGYELSNPFTMYCNQDGVFSASVFNGDYYVTLTSGNGPWVNDEKQYPVTVSGGSGEATISVTPYFTISGANINLNGNTVSASFTVDQIVPDAKLSDVMLLVSKAAFANEGVYIKRANASTLTTGSQTLTVSLSDSDMKAAALYGRIGVKTAGADQAIYSDIIKLR